jgi:cell division septum initiation protein DivIVA
MGNYDEMLDTLEQFDATDGDISEFLNTMRKQIGCAHTDDITPSVFSKPPILKSYLCGWLAKSCRFLSNQKSNVDDLRINISQLISENEKLVSENEELKREKIQLQSSTIKAQESVIKLQDELLKCKADKLTRLSSVVEKAVQQTVKTEIQTYSQVVEKITPQITVKDVKTALREAAIEEDRSKSLMIFGLEEEKGEQLSEKVGNLFQHLGEKSRQESVRLGWKFEAGKHRPVKVKLPTSDHVQRILKQAKILKQSSSYSSVFLAPDRTPSEREDRRGAVAALRKKIHDEPGKRHYIQKGIIVTSDV